MAAAHQPPHDVGAHPSQTDHSKLHDPSFLPFALGQRLLDGPADRGQAGVDVLADVDSKRAPAALGQDLEVPSRLGGLDDTEGVLAPGHRQVAGVVAGDLEEDARVGPALVRLPGGVQETRPEADAGGRSRAIPDRPRISVSACSWPGVISTYASSAA